MHGPEVKHILLALELRLLDPAVRRDPATVDALLAPEFREWGRSGRAYSRAEVLALLAAEEPGPVAIEDFEAMLLSQTAALATYISVHEDGRARRSSVWVRREGAWLLLFHQGTAIRE